MFALVSFFFFRTWKIPLDVEVFQNRKKATHMGMCVGNSVGKCSFSGLVFPHSTTNCFFFNFRSTNVENKSHYQKNLVKHEFREPCKISNFTNNLKERYKIHVWLMAPTLGCEVNLVFCFSKKTVQKKPKIEQPRWAFAYKKTTTPLGHVASEHLI